MKIILNICTHGNERIGLRVAKKLEKLGVNKNVLIVQKANEKALKLNKRFIDQDLNRSFPGKKNGNYEQRRAYELNPIIKSADIVIDIHSTTSALKDAFIVLNLNPKTVEYIKVIKPKYVLLMNAVKEIALLAEAKVGLAFEYGKDNDPVVINEVVTSITRLLNHLKITNVKLPKNKTVTKYFDVVSDVKKPKGYKLLKKIKNYKLVRKGEIIAKKKNLNLVAEEDFYPIIFGENNYKEIFGFKGLKIKR